MINNEANHKNPNDVNAGDDVGFLSSCFINSIYQGVSLNEFVSQIENKTEGKKEFNQPNHHPESQRSSNRLNSSITNDDTPALHKYQKNAVTLSKKSSCSKSMSVSYVSQQEDNDSLIKTYKVSSESEKQKRIYEEKVKTMQNRLNALKKQEDYLSRKMNVYHNKEKELEQIKAEKDLLKSTLKTYKDNRKQMVEMQKQKNVELKVKVKLKVNEAITKMKIKKHAEFDLARTEKQLVNTMIAENAEQLGCINQKKIECIKNTYENYKAEESRKRKQRQDKLKTYYLSKLEKDEEDTQTLKNQIAEMERLEEQYVQSLRTTQKKNEHLFKGSWILKIGEEQSHPKINVNVKKHIDPTRKKSLNQTQQDTQTSIKDKSKIQRPNREKSAEVDHNNKNIDKNFKKVLKKASHSIERYSKKK